MNWHLFLDVVAWAIAPFSTSFAFVLLTGIIGRVRSDASIALVGMIMFYVNLILATLCWAWIIAG